MCNTMYLLFVFVYQKYGDTIMIHKLNKTKKSQQPQLPPEQEAMADGREGVLALREAVERLVEMARGLVERAEEAATEADRGEVGPIPYPYRPRVLPGRTHSGCCFGRRTHTHTKQQWLFWLCIIYRYDSSMPTRARLKMLTMRRATAEVCSKTKTLRQRTLSRLVQRGLDVNSAGNSISRYTCPHTSRVEFAVSWRYESIGQWRSYWWGAVEDALCRSRATAL